MKRQFIFLVVLLITTLQNLTAQKIKFDAKGVVTINDTRGNWKMILYATNILKVVFQPKGYVTNELITDAVIAKPLATPVKVKYYSESNVVIAWNFLQLNIYNDTIFFGRNRRAILTGINNSGDYKGFRFLLQNDEKIFGTGERALPLSRRGYKLNLYNNPAYGYGVGTENLNYSVPFITSSNNYAIFFDNPSNGYLDIGKTSANTLEYGAVSGELNFYIILGDTYADILGSYHKLTGTQPIPPRWAFGNFLSRFGYTSEAQVKNIMQRMKANNIPYDAVIFDLFWFGDSIKGTMGNLDWINKKAWPNPAKMISDFKKEGTKTILITEPFVLQSSSNFNSAKKFLAVDSAGSPYMLTDFYFGSGGLIDIFRNDSKDWFWSKYKQQMNIGVEAWWGDLGEPEKHPSNLYHNLKDLSYKRLFSADEVHNAYGHYWTKMLFDKYAKEYPTKRLFSLNRSGFAGTQRYGIFPWTGDVSRSWNGLKAQLPVLLGMSMSGVPYVHSDAGGFAGGEKEGELYVRWLQFAQFTPIFRPHGGELTGIENTAVNFPSEPALMEEPYRSLAKEVVLNRYKMLPYNYTLAYKQATEGKPLISPLYYNFQEDSTASIIEDEFMWGENILVAPVLEKGAKSRRVYLPKGKWYDYYTNESVEGSKYFDKEVTLNNIPVYVKEGSFIPLVRAIKNTSDYTRGKFAVYYYSSSTPSRYQWFQDDGQSPSSLSTRNFSLINFNGKETTSDIEITASITGNKKFVNDTLSVVIPSVANVPKSVYINGKEEKIALVQGKGWLAYAPTQKVFWFEEKKTLSVLTVFNKQSAIDVKVLK
jgi:oligosaccharide 4-alpha-D-glucosyltransferase